MMVSVPALGVDWHLCRAELLILCDSQIVRNGFLREAIFHLSFPEAEVIHFPVQTGIGHNADY